MPGIDVSPNSHLKPPRQGCSKQTCDIALRKLSLKLKDRTLRSHPEETDRGLRELIDKWLDLRNKVD